MNIKVSIEISERILDRAEDMVRSGDYGSLSEAFEVSMERMVASRDDVPTNEQMDAVTSMADEIRRRMASPPDQWLNEAEFDTEIDKLLAYADKQIKAGR